MLKIVATDRHLRLGQRFFEAVALLFRSTDGGDDVLQLRQILGGHFHSTAEQSGGVKQETGFGVGAGADVRRLGFRRGGPLADQFTIAVDDRVLHEQDVRRRRNLLSRSLSPHEIGQKGEVPQAAPAP